MTTSTWRRRSALLVAAATILAAACGGDDDTQPATAAASAADQDTGATASATQPDDGTGESGDTGGQFGTAAFTIDGTTYEWQSSCSAVRVIDGVTQPGAILQSAGLELTTGAFMVFSMESADGSWSIDISNGETAEAWTVNDPTVSENGGTYEATGEATSTSNPTPRSFELTVSCP
jgi:hypothetical protein